MSLQHAAGWNRREFLGGLTLAGTAGLLGLPPWRVAAEPPPETMRLRLAQTSGICIATYYLAKEFLPAEGFTDVQDVRTEGTAPIKAVVTREVDIALNSSGPLIAHVDDRDPLAGVRCGGYDPLLRPAPPRGRPDQEHTPEGYCQDTDWRFVNELKKELKG